MWRAASSSPGRVGRVVGVGFVVAFLVACGEDGDVDPVETAEARVAAAERDVSEAQAALEESRTAFCVDSADYIKTLDRYGGVFDDAAVTIGDVKAAGGDLEAPREEVASSADAVVEARDELAAAEQDLAEAQVALVEAQSGTSAADAADSTTSTAPLVPTATVDRVEQAEADLANVSEGITDQTPLVEAGTELNAAAFALEISWLRLFADAGCLTAEQEQQAVAAVTEYTMALQTALHTAGYYDDVIDGVYGPSTVAAVEQLQSAAGLPVTGLVDRATAAQLDAAVLNAGGQAAAQALAHTAAVQSTLKLAGYWTGPVDGEWTPELTEALRDFQTALGVEPTGAVDATTLAALEQAIAEAQDAAGSTTTTSASSTSTSTSSAASTPSTTAATAPS